jgi:preprotein translocase subunit SecF
MIYMILDKYWKILMWLTIAFLVISVGILAYNTATTGSFLKKDVDLAGGKVITVEVSEADIQKIKSVIPYANVRMTAGITKTLLVEIPFEVDENAAIAQLKTVVDFSGEPSIRIVGPALGDIFFQQAQFAMIVAFILMAITVFLLFRTIVPSSIVLLCAATDIIGTMGILAIIGMPVSLPIIGALLALIGYSVGTDILLTTELLKSGRTDYKESVLKAAKTGITLTGTAIIALLCMFLISGSTVIEQIALVMLIGLLIDMPATWFTNAGVLRLWLERKQKGKGIE